MYEFNYNTLTINGITKICDDHLYVFNNKLIEYQWNIFQLRYIVKECLKLSTIDPNNNLELSPICLGKLIDNISKNTKIENKDNPKKDIEMGIIPIKTKNSIDINNLGGKLLNPITLEDNSISFDKSLVKYEYYKSISKTTLPKKNIKKILKLAKQKQKMQGQEIPTQIAEPTHDEPLQLQTPNPPSSLAKHTTTSKTDSILNFGSLTWNDNSCFIDSVLMMFLYPIFQGDISEFVKNNFIEKYNNYESFFNSTEEAKASFGADAYLFDCSPKTSPNSYSFERNYQIHKDIFEEFKNLFDQLKNGKGKSIYCNNLIELINSCPKKRGEIFGRGSMADASEFLHALFSIFLVERENNNKENKYYYKNIDDTEPNKIELGSEQFGTQNNVKTIVHNISSKFIESLEKSKTINLSYFLKYVVPDYNDDFYYETEGYKRYTDPVTKQIYVENIRTNEKTEWTEENENLIKINRIDTEFIINNSNNIFFIIDRYIGHGQSNIAIIAGTSSREISKYEIIPDETLFMDNGDLLNLVGIVIWHNNHYVTFVNNINGDKNNWYLYDDNSTTHLNSIGNYQNLLEYSYKTSKNAAIKNSRIVWYSRI